MNSNGARSVVFEGSHRMNERMPEDRPHRPPMRSGTMFPQSHGEDERASLPGSYLGRYRIVEEIGVGGMASVHLACMNGPGGFQKWAAIKKIHSHLVDDDSVIQMFFDEARIAARISHPNVATVFDFDTDDTTHWIAMEYLHGEPLREVVQRAEDSGRAIPAEIACRVIADAAEGLHAAHELVGNNGKNLNLVHRDVSPHNIFVTYEGATKVVDFGIAKFSSRSNHTAAGIVKGKVAYLAPEQARHGVVDRRTDVFALGVVLWELTTGRRLFWRERDVDTIMSVENCVIPRPSTLVRGYPSDLEDIVLTALAKDPADRFDSARDFSRALHALLMRRQMFVASEEVALYMKEVFADRIQERDARLRWASEGSDADRAFRPARVSSRPAHDVIAARESSDALSAREPSVRINTPSFDIALTHPLPTVPAASSLAAVTDPPGLPRWAMYVLAISLTLFVAGVVLGFLAVMPGR